jgi:putative component of membrane protein insertase Oxa1/YidC/SpoIIIJ protein YidD
VTSWVARTVGLLLLLGAIWIYRRFLSGKGPLARVACTFRGTESCSTFGLRAVRESRSVGRAIERIAARLRSCGDASLFVTPDRTLTWGRAYDEDPIALDAKLAARGESPETRAQIFEGHAIVAARSGDAERAKMCRRRARELAAGRPHLALRRAGRPGRVLGCRLGLRLAMLAALLTPSLLLLPIHVVGLAALFAVVLAADATIDSHRDDVARFERQRASIDASARGSNS